MADRDRFWSKVRKTDGCWLWEGGRDSWGYGVFGLRDAGGRRWRSVGAHRLSWIFAYGSIPAGMQVLHNCPGGDNAACVNPAHLWLGTNAQNQADKVAKGRVYRGGAHTILRGEESPRAKLTESDVLDMRDLHALGCQVSDIAKAYGVGWSQASRIIRRESWGHLP